jgi:hypothetical protein
MAFFDFVPKVLFTSLVYFLEIHEILQDLPQLFLKGLYKAFSYYLYQAILIDINSEYLLGIQVYYLHLF